MYLLAIDQTAVLISAIGAFVTLASLAMTLLIKKKVDKVETKVDGYSKQVDGMKTELVEAVRGKAEAEGKEQGRVQQRAEAKEDNAAVTDVKIVDQTDPVKVVTEKPDKNKPT